MKKFIDIDYIMDTDKANKLFILSGRSNGKCAVERQLLKQAKIIKDLKKILNEMDGHATKELYHTDKEYYKGFARGYQECIAVVKWVIYKGEHYEN